jgi:glutathione S-transferase
MLKLYYSPGACALASHIALEEAHADYELVRIDLSKGEQRTPAYLAVNPAGVTPALVTDEGVLTENLAIMWYVAATHPEAGLLPPADAPFELAHMHAVNATSAPRSTPPSARCCSPVRRWKATRARRRSSRRSPNTTSSSITC